jgi:lipopolysaccharide transport system permease protein
MAAVEQEAQRAGGRIERAGRTDPRHFADLVTHLAKREVSSMHRLTLLGWAWPVVRQLAQLAVLVFVFSTILPLGIKDFPVFVFSGLIAWSWFAAGVQQATSALIQQRHLVFHARFPVIVLPVVSVAVPLVDVLLVLPALALLLVGSGELHWTVVLMPPLLVVQLILMCGIAWFTAAATVFLRDIVNTVTVALLLLFYLTPVFYTTSAVPAKYVWVLNLNPMTTLLEAYRGVLLGQPFPGALRMAAVIVGSIVLAVAGWWFFRRLEDRFVDEL